MPFKKLISIAVLLILSLMILCSDRLHLGVREEFITFRLLGIPRSTDFMFCVVTIFLITASLFTERLSSLAQRGTGWAALQSALDEMAALTPANLVRALRFWGGGGSTIVISVHDVLLGGLAGAALTAVNIWAGLETGFSTFFPYDPMTYIRAGQLLSEHPAHLLFQIFSDREGLWEVLVSLGLIVGHAALWKPMLGLFWQSWVIMTTVIFVGGYFLGTRGRMLFATATAFMPLFLCNVVTPARAVIMSRGLADAIWPMIADGPNAWVEWVNPTLKGDLLAATLIALSITLLTFKTEEISRSRFGASGLAVFLAILCKGQYAVVYLAGWGAALLVNSILVKSVNSDYIRKSYRALVVIGVCFYFWVIFGGYLGSIRYIIGAFSHPLANSDEYQHYSLGGFYFLYLIPQAMGFCGQIILIVLLLALALPGTRLAPAIKRSLPFWVGASVMIIPPIMTTAGGKNFNMAMPCYLSLWVGILVFVGEICAQNRGHRMISILFVGGMAAFTLLAAVGFQGIVRNSTDTVLRRDVETDRRVLSSLLEDIHKSGVSNVVSPLGCSGIPDIFAYALEEKALEWGPPKANFTQYYWPENDVAQKEEARSQMLAADALIVIPGGGEAFSCFGKYRSYVEALEYNIATAPDSPFSLYSEYKVPANTADYVYFMNDNHDMTVRYYVRRPQEIRN